MGSGDGDDITALVCGGVSNSDGRISDHKLGTRIDLVRNSVLILNLVDITYNDITGNRVSGNLEGKLTARLAVELSDIDTTSEDNFPDIVQIFTLDGDNVSGQDCRRSERAENDRLGVLQVKSGGSGEAIACDNSDRAYSGIHRDSETDLTTLAGSDLLYGSDCRSAREADLRHFVEIGTDDAKLGAPHHGVRSDRGKGELTGILVSVQFFLLASGQA